MTPSHLPTLLTSLESEHHEFKEWKTKGDFDELGRYACALANEGGGVIVLGVTDKRPRKIVGSLAFPQIEQTRKTLNLKLHLNTQWEEVAHPDGRVVIVRVPAGPVGVPAAFDGRSWMRENDSLLPLSEARRMAIWNQGDHDFTADPCPTLALADLSPQAIQNFREAWVAHLRSARSPDKDRAADRIQAAGDLQLLKDLELVQPNGALAFAALILFGTRAAVRAHLIQAEVIFEFRDTEAPGPAQERVEYQEGFFLYNDAIWDLINKRNTMQSFQVGLQMLPVPTFAQRPVREAVLNAICHRDYRMGSSIFIRQYANRLLIESPGGLPARVSVETILTRQSPRNRRLAEVFQRCGMVERSGQGMDLIYHDAITSAKPLPEIVADPYQVSLVLRGNIQDPAFLQYLEKVGRDRVRLFDISHLLVLDAIRRSVPVPAGLEAQAKQLKDDGLIERVGQGRGAHWILAHALYVALGQPAAYTRKRGLDQDQNKALLLAHLERTGNKGAPIAELQQVLSALSQRQVQHLLNLLRENGKAIFCGTRRTGRWYVPEFAP